MQAANPSASKNSFLFIVCSSLLCVQLYAIQAQRQQLFSRCLPYVYFCFQTQGRFVDLCFQNRHRAHPHGLSMRFFQNP